MFELVKDGRLESEIVRTLLDFNMEKKRAQKIIDGMSNGVMVTNEDLEVILHNQALMQLLGLREEIKAQATVSEIVREEALVQTLKKILQGKSDEYMPIAQEIRIGQRVLRAVSTPAIGLDRNVFIKFCGTVTTFEDITVLKELDRMKSDFVNLVAHELRSPLISLRKLCNVLAEELPGPLNKKQKMLVEMVLSKVEGLSELISDLQDAAKSRNSSGPMRLSTPGP
jgi:signal transduction histidine kinase